MSANLSPAQREAIGRISSLNPQPTVRAWQHATDPDRVLLVWPNGNSMVVNAGRYIEDAPTMEPPDHWLPIGKHPSSPLRTARVTATATAQPIPTHMRGHKYTGHHLYDDRAIEGMLLGNEQEQNDWAQGIAWLLNSEGSHPVNAGSLVKVEPNAG